MRLALFGGLVCVAAFMLSQADAGKKPTVNDDFSAQLPRIAPKEPAEALKTFKLTTGYHVELVAAEPLIRSPVAVDFDEDGRLFVAEFPEYNQIDNPAFKEHGCIKLLEDTNGDGVYDKATVYAADLDSPVAVACWDGGVFVGAVPNILYLKDTDGDGKADVRQVVYTGFAKDRAGEAMLNSFRWGLENRFHVSTSNAGGVVRPADAKDDAGVNVRSQGFLFDPATRRFELTSGGGQHGMSMDDWGRKFVCDNSNPCHMIMYDARYVANNPDVQAPPASVNIAEEARTTKLRRLSPPEPWRVLRTKLRVAGVVPGPVETGQPTGHFTGTTGVTVYRGDAFPESARGHVFVGEVSNNLVYRARLEPSGVGLVAKRADPDNEFLASTDNWFRPAQFANAPDGCLYVIDTYREVIETVVSIPPVILKHLDPASGIDRGRIYRIAPDGHQRRAQPKLSKASTAELVALLEHPNGWHRDTASRLLYQRQDPAAVDALRKQATSSRSPLGRLHSLYALDGLKALKPADVLPALKDPEPRVREHSLRLAERFADDAEVRNAMHRLIGDADVRVRYQLAFSLGGVRDEATNRSLLALAKRDGGDPWIRLAILTSAQGRRGDVLRAFVQDDALRRSEPGRVMLKAIATQIAAARQRGDLDAFLTEMQRLERSEAALARELTAAMFAKLPPADRPLLANSDLARRHLRDLLDGARRTVADEKRPPADRAGAVRTLSLAEFGEVKAVFGELLTARQPEPVQKAALESLSRFTEPAVASLVLDAWTGLSPQVRATAAETLLARPVWVTALLDAIEKGRVKPGELDPSRVALLQASGDPAVKSRAAALFAGSKLSKRQDVLEAYQKALSLKGDVARGKAIFKKDCSACHRLEGVGEQIGAELGAIKDRGSDTVLLNILDPNREVLPRFLTYVLVTDAGRTISGIITGETATSVTVRRADGTSETVLRVNIDELRSTGTSFMPEGLEKQIDVQGMADLLAYLNAAK